MAVVDTLFAQGFHNRLPSGQSSQARLTLGLLEGRIDVSDILAISPPGLPPLPNPDMVDGSNMASDISLSTPPSSSFLSSLPVPILHFPLPLLFLCHLCLHYLLYRLLLFLLLSSLHNNLSSSSPIPVFTTSSLPNLLTCLPHLQFLLLMLLCESSKLSI